MVDEQKWLVVDQDGAKDVDGCLVGGVSLTIAPSIGVFSTLLATTGHSELENCRIYRETL